MVGMDTARVIDYSPLTSTVTASDVTQWREHSRATGARSESIGTNSTGSLIYFSIFLGVFYAVIASFSIAGIVNGIRSANAGAVTGPAILLVLLTGIAVFVMRGLFRMRSGRGMPAKRSSRTRFAEANGLSYAPAKNNPDYKGLLFDLGDERQVIDRLTATSGHFFEMGNYRWIAGGSVRIAQTRGFLAIRLDRALPNIVLDGLDNNGPIGSSLPGLLDRSQVLHLEGDFDRYFTLYCPKQYERDALYVFAPDLMALMIDESARFDAEIVDNWLFVYSPQHFEMDDPATLQRLFRIADTVGAKALTQTDYYADERVGDRGADVVAPEGARLRRRISPVLVVMVSVLVLAIGWFALSLTSSFAANH
jgi:hypothetical protein